MTLITNKSDEWLTPRPLFDLLNRTYGPFDLDAAATDENHLCPKWFTKERSAVARLWRDRVFINPPYGRELPKWMRTIFEHRNESEILVALIPAKVGTRWWYNYVARASLIRFLVGRVTFGSADNPQGNPAQFDSVVVVYNRYICKPAPNCEWANHDYWDWRTELRGDAPLLRQGACCPAQGRHYPF